MVRSYSENVSICFIIVSVLQKRIKFFQVAGNMKHVLDRQAVRSQRLQVDESHQRLQKISFHSNEEDIK